MIVNLSREPEYLGARLSPFWRGFTNFMLPGVGSAIDRIQTNIDTRDAQAAADIAEAQAREAEADAARTDAVIAQTTATAAAEETIRRGMIAAAGPTGYAGPLTAGAGFGVLPAWLPVAGLGIAAIMFFRKKKGKKTRGKK